LGPRYCGQSAKSGVVDARRARTDRYLNKGGLLEKRGEGMRRALRGGLGRVVWKYIGLCSPLTRYGAKRRVHGGLLRDASLGSDHVDPVAAKV
jgi:hypothetical protein